MKYEEAEKIFSRFYPKLKEMARGGDSRAAVMVARSIQYGFSDDDEHPYEYWLHSAKRLKSKELYAKFHEFSTDDNENSPNGSKNSKQDESGAAHMELNIDSDESIDKFCAALKDEILRDLPTRTELDDLGIDDGRLRLKVGNTEETDLDHKGLTTVNGKLINKNFEGVNYEFYEWHKGKI